MKKLFTIMALSAVAFPVLAQTNDFTPVSEKIFWNEATVNHATGSSAPAVNVNLNFPGDVWWVSSQDVFAQQVKLVDADGNDVPFTLYAGGDNGDYTLFYFRLFDLDKYNKDIVTLVIPEGLLGDTEWYNSRPDLNAGRVNPEFRYDLNVWELSGRPEKGLSYDFMPLLNSPFFQEPYDNDREQTVTEVRIDASFPEDVYWKSGFSKECYVLDSEGNVYTDWWPDFGGLSSDWKAMYFGIRGINKYVDADYTLVIPEGLLGNELWKNNAEEGKRTNSEIRIDFNVYKLAGCPREDKTTYDFEPEIGTPEVTKVKVGTHKYDAVRVVLTFPEEVAVYSKLNEKGSVVDLEAEEVPVEPGMTPQRFEYTLTATPLSDDPKSVEVILRGKDIDFKNPHSYRISFWSGAFGTKLWATEDYCEDRANAPFDIEVNTGETGIESVSVENSADAPVYNLHGVRVYGDRLPAGIYIRDGKKVVIK